MNALHALLDSYVFSRSAEENSGMELLSEKIKKCARVSISSFLGTFGFQTTVEYMPEHVEKEIKNVLSSQLGKEVSVRNGIELPCNTADVLPNSLYVTYWFAKQFDSDHTRDTAASLSANRSHSSREGAFLFPDLFVSNQGRRGA